jgi:hypothetical protein
MPHDFKIGVLEQGGDVPAGAGIEIVDAEHIAAFCQEPLAEMRPQEACAPRDQHPFSYQVCHPPCPPIFWCSIIHLSAN